MYIKKRPVQYHFHSFFGVLAIILTLFIVVFFKMTVRKISYSLYHKVRIFNDMQDEYYQNLKTYGRITRSERLEELARKRFLYKKNKGQVIHVINGRIALPD